MHMNGKLNNFLHDKSKRILMSKTNNNTVLWILVLYKFL